MRSIDVIIGEIGVNNHPIIFFDTCSLLDIIRTPVRGTFRSPHADAISTIVAKAEEGLANIFLAQQVKTELDENRGGILADAENGIAAVDEQIDNFLKLMAAYGADVSAFSVRLGSLGFEAVAQGRLSELLATSEVVMQPATAVDLAWGRVGSSIAPARPGKQSMKDCVVIESYFAALDDLRKSGFTGGAHFLSSNTTDYCAAGTKVIHPELEADFQRLGLAFYHDVAAMRYAIWP
ncbi:PIN domain-containing protein [Rhizobiaceae bacterium n13]|uniref:PIN domain-containing protein n=1 Tax=Ferirhizobium litorale TaxID=2927786 RepID=A0AAE3U102_9HYPH|nr:PIN domain-containing protein [Fererhizobium litorale]MDI7860954.1 PIN domain-containing protein [Fererhizobium litorale]MDI7921102.1 PIN domain-containing protein [Fererhizobium litorale]